MVHDAGAIYAGSATAFDAGRGGGVARSGGSGHRRLRVAIAHDWLCGYRGGEGVLERVIEVVQHEHELAGLFVMFDDERPLRPAIDGAPKVVSRVGQWPAASTTRLRQYLMPMYPRAVRQLTHALEEAHARKPIDLLITSSSAAVKNMRPPHGVPHLCYCHSPPRYVWSQAREYRRDHSLRSLGLKFYAKNYQRWDRIGSSPDYVTRLLANSTYTAEQIAQCYERSARVIYPPVRTEFFTPALERVGQSRGDYWLYVGALEPYKRVDLAVMAANKLNQELLEQRLGRYMQHASEISFYADPVQTFPEVPTAVPNPLPPLSRMWDWQMRYWIHGDILRAITEANKVAGGGTPSVLIGLASVKRSSKRDGVLKAIMTDQYRRALMAFPDEDVLVGTRFATVSGYDAFKTLQEIVPRPDYQATGEERAWGRRLAKRFGIGSSRYDERSFIVRGDDSYPEVLDHESLKPEKIDPGFEQFFTPINAKRGDALIAFGWAMADDLLKLA